ncbi:MAG: helix-turn-helix transcriptional regulator [Gammaproteobacteria bacterium]|nr:helix-turn-helix transcriptional regulator [Gammaproteobacteria bacterium]
MTSQLAELSRLLEIIYRAPLEQAPWQQALAALRERIPSDSSILVLRKTAEFGSGRIYASGLHDLDPNDPDNPYASHFYQLDPFVNLPPGQVITLAEFVGTKALLASEFYQQHLLPANIRHILGVDTADGFDIANGSGTVASWRWLRRQAAGDFSMADRQLCQLLAPHLQQVLRLQNQLAESESERSLFAGTVNQLAVACIVLDEQGRILTTNTGADQLLNEQESISRRNQRLKLGTRRDQQQLETAVAAVLHSQQRNEHCIPQALSVARSKGKPPLGLIVKPIPKNECVGGQSGPGVAVFISDPTAAAGASEQVLCQLFEFTPAEARLASLLADGHSLEQASTRLGISKHTGRAHLRAIFSKTGVSQQSQLVSLILKSVAQLG